MLTHLSTPKSLKPSSLPKYLEVTKYSRPFHNSRVGPRKHKQSVAVGTYNQAQSPNPSQSVEYLQRRLLQLQKNAIQQRKNIINNSKKQLNRSWRSLCRILRTQNNSEDLDESQGACMGNHNKLDQENILDVCVQLIIKERISLQKENIQLQKIRNLHNKSMMSSNFEGNRFNKKMSQKQNKNFIKNQKKNSLRAYRMKGYLKS